MRHAFLIAAAVAIAGCAGGPSLTLSQKFDDGGKAYISSDGSTWSFGYRGTIPVGPRRPGSGKMLLPPKIVKPRTARATPAPDTPRVTLR